MYNQMAMYSQSLDGVFSALSDPTRRRMLERLARGSRSVGEVAAGFRLSQPALSKHVKVLERSGLVKRTIAGRVHRLELVAAPIVTASRWIDRQRRFWEHTLARLAAVLVEEGVNDHA
jgi:DNA-binding transcriptional ArsR family regulator